MMILMVIDHHRHMHDFFLRHGHGYLNDLFNGLLNNSLLMVYLAYNDDFFLLLRDMVIDYHFLFDMMMTVMMHYNGNEDHFFLCHRHWDLDNLLHLALKKRAPEGSSLALAQFPPSHVGRESPQSPSARHGDDDGCSRPLEHAQSLLVSSGLALQLYARPVGSGQVGSGHVGSWEW